MSSIIEPDIDQAISAARLRLRVRMPFFATLALFAHIVATHDAETAATDGQHVLVNPDYVRTLTPVQLDYLLLHKVLHAALLHVPRRGNRDPKLWNIAGDIVVNGMIAALGGSELPANALRHRQREQLSVEEVYELLLRDAEHPDLIDADLLDRSPDEIAPGSSEDESMATARNAQLETYWRTAHQHAQIISFGVAQGKLPSALTRELSMLSPARLDWRAHLWRYLVQTPTDFQGFDRRFIGRGLYLDTLVGESVQVFVAVDTSGSVDNIQIRLLVSEVQGILAAYPHIICDLYYADSRVHGPYRLTPHSDMPPPIGGGGTDFRPFFRTIESQRNPHESSVCVYLTDGFGDFPAEPPEIPVLWVVTAGGRSLDVFPFGEAVRLLT